MVGVSPTNETVAQTALSSENTIWVEITANLDGLAHFVPKEPGRIRRCILWNGEVACDGTNGYEIFIVNNSNSGDMIGYFGYGSGTEAAKATDKTAALAAYYTEATGTDHILNNSIDKRFNANDFLRLIVDRDGTTVRGKIFIELDFDGKGRTL